MSNLPATQGNQALTIIESMVTSGNFDVSVAKELVAMQKEIMAQQAIINFNNDFAEMSKKIPVIAKTKKAHNTWYAPLEDIVSVVQPILSEHGFSISFSTKQDSLESVAIACTLMHRDGHSTKTELILPTKAVNNGMNPMQAIGAAITYGKRYTLCGMLNITTGEDDNNGFTVNAKTAKPPIDDDRLTKAIESINNKTTTLDKVIGNFKLTPEQLIRIGQEVKV